MRMASALARNALRFERTGRSRGPTKLDNSLANGRRLFQKRALHRVVVTMIKDYNALYGGELLVAAFAQLPPRTHFKVTDSSDIVSALYRIQGEGDWGNLFTNYPFDTDGIEPRSVALTEAIDGLQQARLLGRRNPDLVDYRISPGVKISYERFVKKKVGDNEPLVIKLAERLKTELKIQSATPNAEGTNREVRR